MHFDALDLPLNRVLVGIAVPPAVWSNPADPDTAGMKVVKLRRWT